MSPAGATGIAIPKGDPDALLRAAGLLAAVADVLDGQAGALDSAQATVTAADWSGEAAMAYGACSQAIGLGMTTGSGALRVGAGIARQFGHELADCQRRARDAQRRAEHALEQIAHAQRRADNARTQAIGAEQRADGAMHVMQSATLAGPAGATALAQAQSDHHQASTEAGHARAEEQHAERARREAEDELRRAQKDGRKATEDADRAARNARAGFSEIAGQAQAPAVMPTPAVPVSLRGANPDDLGAMLPNDPFLPFRFATAGTARAAQIAQARWRAEAAGQQAAEERKGGIADRFGGEAEGLLGIHLFGNPTTDGYREGRTLANAAGFVPTPGTLEHLGALAVTRVGGKVAAHEAEHVAERTALREGDQLVTRGRLQVRRFWREIEEFDGHRVYKNDGLIDPLQKDTKGRTNLERMRRGLAPEGPDGESVELHHTTQLDDGALAEIEHTFHVRHRSVLHVNWPPQDFPSGIDRPGFVRWKRQYWAHRAEQLPGPERGAGTHEHG